MKETGCRMAYPVMQAGVDADVMGMKALQGYEEAFGRLRAMGYEGVELLVRDPSSVDRVALGNALKSNGLLLAAVGTSPMQKLDQLFLLDRNSARAEYCMEKTMELLELCGTFGAVASFGKLRGTVSQEPGCTMEDLEERMAVLIPRAQREGVRIALEPQSKSNINNLNSFAEVRQFTERVMNRIREKGIAAPGIHGDLFHMNLSEPAPWESLEDAGEELLFVHLSDTDRRVPGQGELDFRGIVKTLQRMNYRGFLSPEIRQIPDSIGAAEQSIRFMQSVFAETEEG